MRRNAVLCSLIGLLSVTPARSTLSAEPPDSAVSGVYAKVLHALVAPGAVVWHESVAVPSLPTSPLKGIPADLVSQLVRISAEPALALRPGVELPAGSFVFSQELGGEAFEKAFPGSGGRASLSRVAFDPSRHSALVYLAHGRSGQLVLLRLRGSSWSVSQRATLWLE